MNKEQMSYLVFQKKKKGKQMLEMLQSKNLIFSTNKRVKA